MVMKLTVLFWWIFKLTIAYFRAARDSAKTMEIKRSSGNLADMTSVDYMFICRDMVVQFNIGYLPQRLQLHMLYSALINDTSLERTS